MFLLLFSCATSCCDKACQDARATLAASGGGQDAVTIHLPFAQGTSHRCTQGVNGSYSHQGTSTKYDLDFDTDNSTNEVVYAPVSGIARVHTDDATANFGYHVNIDTGDGSYIVLGHLSSVFLADGSEVSAGQLVGFEGTTGNSTGDHLHIGRHYGDAGRDAVEGTSEEGLLFFTEDVTSQVSYPELATADFTCDISYGHRYASLLPVPLWHPNGVLVKTPDASTVYLIEDGEARAFLNEEAFLSRRFDFADVTLISSDELACFPRGNDVVNDGADVSAVYDDAGSGDVWLLVREDGLLLRQEVANVGWEDVLLSWGIVAFDREDLPKTSDGASMTGYSLVSGYATYRDGSLISPDGESDVYLMSNGIAQPIFSWDTYLLAGFGIRSVIEVDALAFSSVVRAQGNCGTDTYCITNDDLVQCGGPAPEDEGVFEEEVDEDDDCVDSDPPVGGGGDSSVLKDTAIEEDPKKLKLSWKTPSGMVASRITLGAEYVPIATGVSSGWQTLGEVYGVSEIVYERDVEEGDFFRFSLEYVIGGVTSWSCLAPYPPGTVQGTSSAIRDGVMQNILPYDDDWSDGCGLAFTVE